MSPTLLQRIRESITWLSVQVQALWLFIWFMYSQLPSETMVQLAQVQFKLWVFSFTVPGLMGMAHAATTYMARLKKQAAPGNPKVN